MTALYLDAYSGISGDMLLGALIDVGADVESLTQALCTLDVGGWELQVKRASQRGISGTSVSVEVTGEQPVRRLSDILALMSRADLPEQVQRDASSVFQRLAEAEAKVHGSRVEEVHFHEVGAVDSIIDIIGGCLALHELAAERVYCSPLPLGSGFVSTRHGQLPVPAPATLELLSAARAPLVPDRGEGEMVTPTGAALAVHFASFELPAVLRPAAVGYGFGKRLMPWPNALRAVLLDTAALAPGGSDTVVELECNVDDMPGEQLAFALERALQAGALDAWWTPIGMKKGRPAVTLTVLAEPGSAERMARVLLTETSTLGVRYSERQRWKSDRDVRTVQTEFGPVRVKLKILDGRGVAAAPEYDDCARLAQQHAVPLDRVYSAARKAAQV